MTMVTKGIQELKSTFSFLRTQLPPMPATDELPGTTQPSLNGDEQPQS